VPTISPGTDCLQAGGSVHSESFSSYNLGEDLQYEVYLPPCYHDDVERTYPVLYLLHGLSFNQDQWLRLGVAGQMDQLSADGSIAPFIIIMPGEARFQPPYVSAFADALVKELIPWVDQQYRTQPEKPNRAIGGLSRGAAWAVHLAFENHHLFSSVGAHSLPLFEIDGGRLSTWLAQNPADELPDFWIDIGRVDPERVSAQNFADQLNANHIPHTWYLFNGGHTEAYWSAHLAEYLRWYARDW
jgi:enterochelin esterase-like enzyme